MDDSNNLFKMGIDYSVIMGVFTTLISLSVLYADQVPPLALAAVVLLLAGPAAIYTMQRRTQVSAGGAYNMWDLWRMGVVAVFFGTIFTAFVTYGVLQFLRPEFIYTQFEMVLETYKQIPELKDSATVAALQAMIDDNAVPTSFDYTLNMFVMTNCSGMLLGMLTAMLAARKR